MKEVVIAVEEAVGRLEVSFNSDDDEFEEVEQKVPQQAASSPVVRLSILTGLYAACELFSSSIHGKATDHTQRSHGRSCERKQPRTFFDLYLQS